MKHHLDWREGKVFLGEELLAGDELEAARVMLKRNLAVREDSFTTHRGGTACFTAGVGWAADRVVRTNPGGRPVFKRVRSLTDSQDGDPA